MPLIVGSYTRSLSSYTSRLNLINFMTDWKQKCEKLNAELEAVKAELEHEKTTKVALIEFLSKIAANTKSMCKISSL